MKQNRFQLTCLPVSLFSLLQSGNMTCEQWMQEANALGFDGYDVSTLFFRNRTPAYLLNMQQTLDRLPMVMMTSYPDLIHPEPVQALRERAYFMSDVALASQLGCKYVRITPGQRHPEIEKREGIKKTLDVFADMAEYASGLHVQLVYENHAKPGAWNEFDFSCETEVFLEICGHLHDIGVRVNFDFGNPVAMGENPQKLLERILPLVETVHISDMAAWNVFAPCRIGSGVVPIRHLIRQLNEAGFTGWYSIEEASNMGMDGIRNAKNYVIELFQTL